MTDYTPSPALQQWRTVIASVNVDRRWPGVGGFRSECMPIVSRLPWRVRGQTPCRVSRIASFATELSYRKTDVTNAYRNRDIASIVDVVVNSDLSSHTQTERHRRPNRSDEFVVSTTAEVGGRTSSEPQQRTAVGADTPPDATRIEDKAATVRPARRTAALRQAQARRWRSRRLRGMGSSRALICKRSETRSPQGRAIHMGSGRLCCGRSLSEAPEIGRPTARNLTAASHAGQDRGSGRSGLAPAATGKQSGVTG